MKLYVCISLDTKEPEEYGSEEVLRAIDIVSKDSKVIIQDAEIHRETYTSLEDTQ